VPETPASPPPEISVRKATPTFSCVVQAPGLTAGAKLDITEVPKVLQAPVKVVFAAIFNAKAFVELIEQMPSEESKLAAWDNGPWGQQSLSLRAYFGPYSSKALAMLKTSVVNVARIVFGREPLVVKTGRDPAYVPDENLLVLAAAQPAQLGKMTIEHLVHTIVVEPLVKMVPNRDISPTEKMGTRIAAYMWARQGSAPECILTGQQVPSEG